MIPLDSVPAPVVALCQTLQQRGFEAYLVGGSVRDLLSGRAAKDWDVATAAPPDEVQRAFRRTIPTGLRHGTVTVLLAGGLAVEVTTFRAEEGHSDGRHPDRVVFGVDLATDLQRRDFTINAMALDPLTGAVVDPHDGRADLAAGVIRAVGDPAQRFAEDGLRPLRAVRFATVLGFAIETATLAAIPAALPIFLRVSGERVRDELFKLLAAPRPARGLELLRETGLLLAILAGHAGQERPDPAGPIATAAGWSAAMAACDALAPDPVLRLVPLAEAAAATSDVTVAALAERLRLSRHDRDRLARLAHRARPDFPQLLPVALRRYAQAQGGATLGDALALERAGAVGDSTRLGAVQRWQQALEQVLSEHPPLELRDLAIDGKSVTERAGRPPGPHVRRLLAALLDQVVERPELNRPETLLALLDELLARRDGAIFGP